MLNEIKQRIDKDLIKQRFSSAVNDYDNEAIAQQYVYNRLGEFIDDIGKTHYNRVLEIGAGTGAFSSFINKKLSIDEFFVNDLTDNILSLKLNNPNTKLNFLIGDAESIDLGNSYDLIVSASAIQWFHEPILFIRNIYEKLNEGASMLISSFSEQNLKEIKSITGIGLDYYSLDYLKEELHKIDDRFELKEEIYTLQFDKAIDVLRHLKSTGVTATSSNKFVWTKEKLADFEKKYKELYTLDNNKLSLSYHPIYIRISK